MTYDPKTKIAGEQTIENWIARKELLNIEPSRENWEKTFIEFLLERIRTRYLDPIEAISNISESLGKGFSIVAIYCSLIEFFESLKKGYEYRDRKFYDKTGQEVNSSRINQQNGNYYKLSNGDMFEDFLTQNSPFDSIFTPSIARSFYENVRCPILHQAETNINWHVRNGTERVEIVVTNSINNFIINWKPLKRAFDKYLNEIYKDLLLSDAVIQENFKFKFDKICSI